MIITLVNVEGDPGVYTGIMFACGPTQSCMHVYDIGIERVSG